MRRVQSECEWSSQGGGSDHIIITPRDPDFSYGRYWISVVAPAAPANFELQVWAIEGSCESVETQALRHLYASESVSVCFCVQVCVRESVRVCVRACVSSCVRVRVRVRVNTLKSMSCTGIRMRQSGKLCRV